MNDVIAKPLRRSRIRKFFGKEFYILKRKLRYIFGKDTWALEVRRDTFSFTVFSHKSILLRELKNVDMWLQKNKIENLRLAIKNIDGIVIKPGESFSIWRLTGRPTKRKGYKIGMVLENGAVKQGTGGGLCQLGNLLYWMALHSPLTVKERWRHGYDVFPDVNRTIPFGCGATLSYNYIDLILHNNTLQTFQIKLWLCGDYLNGAILTNEKHHFEYFVTETEHKIEHQWWGGYTRHNRIERTVKNKENGAVKSELVAENHAIMMYQPFLCESDAV